MIHQCGFDPLASHKKDNLSFSPLKEIADILKKSNEGMRDDNLHYFYEAIDAQWPTEAAAISKDDLLRYEYNIVNHTQKINARRYHKDIVWKYFQWLSLLFTEIYLDRYFNDKDNLLESLNDYVNIFNTYWQGQGYGPNIDAYTIDDLNKICLQNATGSGKTLLMHINFLQFQQYMYDHALSDKFDRSILITPNESLSEQHQRELSLSEIASLRLLNMDDLADTGISGSNHIRYTEITKLSNDSGPNLIQLRGLGDRNLLLVDEGHRGMGSREEKGWFNNRKKLAERGFVFEYSATFREAIAAAKDSEIESSYSKNILFDYSYRYFYEDGYGKDYRIFNLPNSYEDVRFNYLMACLLSFYQQLKLYNDKKNDYVDYHLEKPLWVFVGQSVTKSGKSQEEIRTMSDIAIILEFISNMLKDEKKSIQAINRIINMDSEANGLIDEDGNDIFTGTFGYIKSVLLREDWQAGELFKDILVTVFLSEGTGTLNLLKIKGDDSEVILRVGENNLPFGLINVGEASRLISHIEEEQKNDTGLLSNLYIAPSDFSDKQFKKIHHSSSDMTMLLGSKKFVEGWDCWRVSTLGLMHVGKKEGSQIIQLFGRGVRLKGHDFKLKRSEFATPLHQPDHIHYLETLNIFGVEADFMKKFKEFLADEKLPENDVIDLHEIPIKFNHNFKTKLKIVRTKVKSSDGREYNFDLDGKTPSIGEIPDDLMDSGVKIDWYPRIQAIRSKLRYGGSAPKNTGDTNKNPANFSPEHLLFLDYDSIFFALERFKHERGWHNLNITKEDIRPLLANRSWYKMHVPEQNMSCDDPSNIPLWQKIAIELLRKYCDRLYNYRKMEFIKNRLEIQNLLKKDDNIPQQNKYQISVRRSDTNIVQDVKLLKKLIENKKDEIFQQGNFKALLFNSHLYEPLISITGNNKVRMEPGPIVESELQFTKDLLDYLKKNSRNDEEKFFLLRNQSKGKGMGFFEAGNFHPDFIMWKMVGGKQYITFIEPHGLMHETMESSKIKFHETIKDIEKRLNSENVKLSSFIITPTKHAKLKWGKDISALKEINVLFMNDKKDTYIKDMMEKVDNS